MSSDLDFYRTQSRWTDPGRWAAPLAEIPPDPATLPLAIARLLLHPFVAPMRGVEIPAAATGDRDIRSVEAMLDRLQARDPRPLAVARAPEHRLFCVCAGFARLATAVFRLHAIPARCRVGFAAYFNPGFLEDHWVCEYRDGDSWRLLDAQLDADAVAELGVGFAPSNVPRDRFIDASTAWRRLRAGELDATRMGLSVLGLAGTWFAVGNLMLDVRPQQGGDAALGEVVGGTRLRSRAGGARTVGRRAGPGGGAAPRIAGCGDCPARLSRALLAPGDAHRPQLRQRDAGGGARALSPCRAP
jgi:hypothetical protein